MNNKKSPYILTILIVLSTIMFSFIGKYWNDTYYNNNTSFSLTNLPLATAMQGIHDGLYVNTFSTSYDNSVVALSSDTNILANTFHSTVENVSINDICCALASTPAAEETAPETYEFTTASEDYFNDACFIGDSRTVGICEYSGITNATFLCKSSLSIYDYEKPKILYDNKKTSIHDVLSEKEFSKIYLMLGINECGIGTPESFLEKYTAVLNNIRMLQPNAIIFIQANLLVTEEKSSDNTSVTNENISVRNELIASLANQKDIFYIDINESSLCKNGSLVAEYTWDQVHIKAQYYDIWKDFLLNHAIIA